MKFNNLTITVLVCLIISCFAFKASNEKFDLKIIEQDYDLARAEALKDGKLLFIDFYTTWCGPCKKLDKLVFQNDSIQKILKQDIILLRYDAENDTLFNLSKKHHVSSYPTGIILNQNGRVVNRKYGFTGDDFESLGNSVLEFINEGVKLNNEGKFLEGYSNEIDPSIYPAFYTDFVNRTDTKIDSSEINDYLSSSEAIFSEQYFSTLLYFAQEASDDIAEVVLKNKDRYMTLYGKTDLEILIYSFVSGKFSRAISQKDQTRYEEAIQFAKNGLSKKWTDDILPSFEKEYLMAQNKWSTVFEINQHLKDNGELSNGYINHFSWQVYKKCDDEEVIKGCLEWMKEVTAEEPTFDYLDTYAYLLYKSGNKEATKRIAELAIEAGKKEDRKTGGLQKLIEQL